MYNYSSILINYNINFVGNIFNRITKKYEIIHRFYCFAVNI